MLSTNHSLKRLNILKRSKVEPMMMTTGGNVSLDDLAFLVKRLSVQVDDLVEENNQHKKAVSSPVEQQQQQQQLVTLLPPAPTPQSNFADHPLPPLTIDTSFARQHSHSFNKASASHTTIDPWASYVPQNYGALLQRLEDIESLQKCPNDCCASTGTVSSADGVPWPQPIEPFNKTNMDTLDMQYTHWCTLMRCLPLMDPVTSAHVKTVGLYAMREILKSKANQKRSEAHHQSASSCCNHHSATTPTTATTTTRLRDSMSCLSIPEQQKQQQQAVGELIAATQDMPSWMSTSETKTALNEEAAPVPPPKEGNDHLTPTCSGFPSPLAHVHTAKRFQRWVQYKKSKSKTNTDTATTPLENKSQTLRKIGSWFF